MNKQYKQLNQVMEKHNFTTERFDKFIKLFEAGQLYMILVDPLEVAKGGCNTITEKSNVIEALLVNNDNMTIEETDGFNKVIDDFNKGKTSSINYDFLWIGYEQLNDLSFLINHFDTFEGIDELFKRILNIEIKETTKKRENNV